MMKSKQILILFFLVLAAFSCEDEVIESQALTPGEIAAQLGEDPNFAKAQAIVYARGSRFNEGAPEALSQEEYAILDGIHTTYHSYADASENGNAEEQTLVAKLLDAEGAHAGPYLKEVVQSLAPLNLSKEVLAASMIEAGQYVRMQFKTETFCGDLATDSYHETYYSSYAAAYSANGGDWAAADIIAEAAGQAAYSTTLANCYFPPRQNGIFADDYIFPY